MTPDQTTRLRAKQWRLRANMVRPTVSRVIADALGIAPSEVVFADEEETKRVSALFAAQIDSNKPIELFNRQKAIEFVRKELTSCVGHAFLLPHDYDDCGAVKIEMADAIANMDALLRSQYECFRLASADGKSGACVVTQEGSEAQYPRYVAAWKNRT